MCMLQKAGIRRRAKGRAGGWGKAKIRGSRPEVTLAIPMRMQPWCAGKRC